MYTGSCYCGDIHYRIEGEIMRTSSCRHDAHSSAIDTHIDWLTVPSDSVVLISGTPTHRTVDGVTHTFCGRCGTLLTYRDEGREEIDVTASSLDEGDSIAVVPQRGTELQPGVAEPSQPRGIDL